MQRYDVAIVGSGLAGSLAAAMLGRAGRDIAVIDPHPVYPQDFRCEKLDGPQVKLLEKTGLAAPVLRAGTFDRVAWVARFGHLVEKRPGDQFGILYDTLVNTVRSQIPPRVRIINAKVGAISTSDETQTLALSNGEELSARLIVLATGLNNALRTSLGIEREEISSCHSIMAGFNMHPVGRASFPFGAMTYYGERRADRTAYITMFPIAGVMRANLCFYRDMKDPWVRRLRSAPKDMLIELMPRLTRLTGDFDIPAPIEIRPADLYVTKEHIKPGLVLIGDAFSTSCPAAGTGARKALSDAERLCNVYIPRWLESAGMGTDKIAAFYDDADKRACDAFSLNKAYHLRSMTLERGLAWTARRALRFAVQFGVGTLRHWLDVTLKKTPAQEDANASASGASSLHAKP